MRLTVMGTNPQTEAQAIARCVRGCATDDQYVELVEAITTALEAKEAELALEKAERNALRVYAHESTKVITSIAGGGSELFGRQIGDVWTADLAYCDKVIRERRPHKAEVWKERARAERAEAALAEARKALEHIERKVCDAENGYTFMDVLANYREVRRAVQDARAVRRALIGEKKDG